MYARQYIISSGSQLAFLSDRVVNSLSGQRQFSEKDKQVFEKAKLLLDSALDGSEILRTGQLQARAVEQLSAYGLTVHAYAALAQNRKTSQKEDLQQVIRAFLEDLGDLVAGTVKDTDRIEMLREFFAFMRDISLRSDMLAFDKVSIQRRGSYGIICYR